MLSRLFAGLSGFTHQPLHFVTASLMAFASQHSDQAATAHAKGTADQLDGFMLS
ncbi:hypothetical protein INR99_16640 [Chitinilyticum litopenaei]|uniref:Uncharacterized protein n=1 Tax=Chitinilyticum piscinae TaxID=2866724 RepID=A0A8J7KC46_9NEIS|nr:hypothetical protein [Chitinilyticum piscinae]MBE9610954.1 hypothetical protein [Chitinilyticum piscinae]